MDVNQVVVALPVRCQLEHLGGIRSDLVRGLDAPAMVIDCGGLNTIDTAGVQLLAATALAAARRGVVLTWRAVPSMLQAAAIVLGLAEHLGLPAAQEG